MDPLLLTVDPNPLVLESPRPLPEIPGYVLTWAVKVFMNHTELFEILENGFRSVGLENFKLNRHIWTAEALSYENSDALSIYVTFYSLPEENTYVIDFTRFKGDRSLYSIYYKALIRYYEPYIDVSDRSSLNNLNLSRLDGPNGLFNTSIPTTPDYNIFDSIIEEHHDSEFSRLFETCFNDLNDPVMCKEAVKSLNFFCALSNNRTFVGSLESVRLLTFIQKIQSICFNSSLHWEVRSFSMLLLLKLSYNLNCAKVIKNLGGFLHHCTETQNYDNYYYVKYYRLLRSKLVRRTDL